MNGNKTYLIKNIITSIYAKDDVKSLISKKLRIDKRYIAKVSIIKKSIDARKKSNIRYNYTCIAEFTKQPAKSSDLLFYEYPKPYLKEVNRAFDKHPFIIGSGPAGLFAALGLVQKGYEPYIFERGKPIAKREKDVEQFWQQSVLNPNSNVQFGEGGAGTFSDGKLTARNQDYYTYQVFDTLIRFGADNSIKTDALPHLGTDNIRKIVKNIRSYLIEKNAKFFWNATLNDIEVKDNKITRIRINDDYFSPETLILAVGNSARDTFELLKNRKIILSSKPFAVGFRIEHPQDFVNNAVYGNAYKILGNASYRLTAKIPKRGAYTFCMCPGGYVVASASEENMQVTNGMSYAKRDNFYANSAVVVTVSQDDFGDDELGGIAFQRNLEKAAYNKDFPYFSPFQTAQDFIKGRKTKQISETSYLPGTYLADFNDIFHKNLGIALGRALQSFDKKMRGFIKNGNLLGVETRTSSPVRILRDRETYRSVSAVNLFPIGEGAGYAGGIVSSAADGYKLSQTFSER